MTVPTKLLEQLKFYCEAESLGFAEISGPDFTLFMIGNKELSPDQVSVLAAYTLLRGVVFGNMNERNEEIIDSVSPATRN